MILPLPAGPTDRCFWHWRSPRLLPGVRLPRQSSVLRVGAEYRLDALSLSIGVYVGILISMRLIATGNRFGNRSIPEYLGDRYQSDTMRLMVSLLSLVLFFYLAGQLVSGVVMFEIMLAGFVLGAWHHRAGFTCLCRPGRRPCRHSYRWRTGCDDAGVGAVGDCTHGRGLGRWWLFWPGG